ncbi:MAG: hypothetical protein HYT75_05840 [Deltaproteobacteria bacterium]|nr:hypothetical protein [Deltaproteobacteria bacterium]
MPKKFLILTVILAVSFAFSARAEAPKQAAKSGKVIETRMNEADMDRLASAVNRAVKEAVIAKQGPSGFEYMAKRMKPPKNDKWKGRWNELGSEGWEAVDHFENIYIFKRVALAASYSLEPARVKPASAPAAAEPAAAAASTKEDDKAAQEAEKAAKKAEK